MVKVRFFYKEGCWLCDTALEMLNGLRERFGIEVERVDIDSDTEIYEAYRFDIPVVEFADGSALHGQIKKKALMRKLDDNKE